MTITRARAILSPPLQFGNLKQIAAADFIAEVETCVAAMKDCSQQHGKIKTRCGDCSGRGSRTCRECEEDRECQSCDGSGTITSEACECLKDFRPEVIAAADWL
jgi:hypothetical protein